MSDNKPNLGLATTRELLNELTARIEVDGKLDYRTAEPSDNRGAIIIDDSQQGGQVPARVLPEGKRVVRTKASGDRVYLLDEVKKTRQWVTNPEVLDSLGFTLNDVGEVEEDEMLRYQMGAALYRRVDE